MANFFIVSFHQKKNELILDDREDLNSQPLGAGIPIFLTNWEQKYDVHVNFSLSFLQQG